MTKRWMRLCSRFRDRVPGAVLASKVYGQREMQLGICWSFRQALDFRVTDVRTLLGDLLRERRGDARGRRVLEEDGNPHGIGDRLEVGTALRGNPLVKR